MLFPRCSIPPRRTVADTIRCMRAAPPADYCAAPVASGNTWTALLVTPENPDNDEDPTAGRILKAKRELSFTDALFYADLWTNELQRRFDRAAPVVLNMAARR